jgi:hypothetical protein
VIVDTGRASKAAGSELPLAVVGAAIDVDAAGGADDVLHPSRALRAVQSQRRIGFQHHVIPRAWNASRMLLDAPGFSSAQTRLQESQRKYTAAAVRTTACTWPPLHVRQTGSARPPAARRSLTGKVTGRVI